MRVDIKSEDVTTNLDGKAAPKAKHIPKPGDIRTPKPASAFCLKPGAFFLLGDLPANLKFEISSPYKYKNHIFDLHDFEGHSDSAFTKDEIKTDSKGNKYAVLVGYNPIGSPTSTHRLAKYRISVGCRVMFINGRKHPMCFGPTASGKLFKTDDDGLSKLKPLTAIRLRDMQDNKGRITIGDKSFRLSKADLFLLKHPIRTGVWMVATRKQLEFYGEIPSEKTVEKAWGRPNRWANYGVGPKPAATPA